MAATTRQQHREGQRPKPKQTSVPGIRQDGPNRFLVRARWNDSTTGQRRKREGIATSLAEAVALQTVLKRSEAPDRLIRQRFSAYAEDWLAVQADLLAPSTQERYAIGLAHAIAGLGSIYVEALEVRHVRAWITTAAKMHAPATTNGWLRVLRQCLEPAVEDGLLPFNPARKVKARTEGRTRGRRGNALSVTELRNFVATIEAMMAAGEVAPDVGRLILTLAWTGMRRGEALALRWSDWVDGELRIERSVFDRQEKATKTDDPRRVAVVEPLLPVLTEQRQWLRETNHEGQFSGLVFPASPRHARGRMTRLGSDELLWYRSGSVMDLPLRKIVAKAGVTPISPHSFRRTWENIMRQAGIDLLVRRSLAGWRTDEAQAIYATVAPAERRAAGRRVVELVLGEPGRVRREGTDRSENKNAREEMSSNRAE